MSDFEIQRFIQDIKLSIGIDITKRSRKRDSVYARAVFFSVVKKRNPRITLTKLGSFVNMEHTSVLYWVNQKNDISSYDDFKQIEKSIKEIAMYKHTNEVVFCNQIQYNNGKN